MSNASDVAIKEFRCIMDVLPPELLWKIFMINTECCIPYNGFGPDEHDSRLDTARSCSQVCRLWRTLLLQASSVWGRLLDIQSFEHTADEWREAVISRIGEAPLWIIGTVSDSTRPFILSVLQKKWHNVQVLVVRDKDLHDDKIPLTWSFLEREALTLEVFKLRTDTFYNFHMDARQILPFPPLFRNSAPRLKSFMTLVPFQLTLPIPSWLANLHSVTFDNLHSVPTILSGLKSIPYLKHLYIFGDTPQFPTHVEDGDVDKPYLPLLETLIINNRNPNPEALNLLLESITLAPGQHTLRSLRIPKIDERPGPLDPPQQRLHRSMIKWIHAYMDGSSPHYLQLVYYNQFVLDLTMRTTPHNSTGQMKTSFLLDSHSDFTIKNLAQSPQFSAVKTLYVLFGILSDLYDRSMKLFDSSPI